MKDKNSCKLRGKYISGIANVKEEQDCNLICYDDKILFEMLKSDQLLELSRNKILCIDKYVETNEEIYSNQGRAFKRAIIGDFLAGLPGAFIGSVTTSDTVKTCSTSYIRIEYLSNDGNNTYSNKDIYIQIGCIDLVVKVLNEKLKLDNNDIEL